MARPTKPLITKEKTLEVALKIVDEEGLSALSVRRLGRELSIHGFSLYHHFKNKDGILVALCEHVLDQVIVNRPLNTSWQEWILESHIKSYEALSQHPNLIPALLKYNLLGTQKSATERISKTLIQQGLAPEAVLPLIEGLTIITAGLLSLDPLEDNFKSDDSLETDAPTVYKLGTQSGFLPRIKLLEFAIKSLIKGIEEKYAYSEE